MAKKPGKPENRSHASGTNVIALPKGGRLAEIEDYLQEFVAKRSLIELVRLFEVVLTRLKLQERERKGELNAQESTRAADYFWTDLLWYHEFVERYATLVPPGSVMMSEPDFHMLTVEGLDLCQYEGYILGNAFLWRFAELACKRLFAGPEGQIVASSLATKIGNVIQLKKADFQRLSGLKKVLNGLHIGRENAYKKALKVDEPSSKGGQRLSVPREKQPNNPTRPKISRGTTTLNDRHKTRKEEGQRLFGAHVKEELFEAMEEIARERGMTKHKLVHDMIVRTIKEFGSKELRERLAQLEQEEIERIAESRRVFSTPEP